jgi:hypothetical protein
MRKGMIAALALAALGASATLYFTLARSRPEAREIHPVWAEAGWPFAMDQWGTGKAFRCAAKDCGSEISIYLRPKIGFCNCTTGVADDEELERVADFDLFRNGQTALAQGRPIEVRWMKGRSRPYAFAGPSLHQKSTLTIAFNERCDVIIATAVTGESNPAEVEPLVLGFLNGDIVIHWAEKTLGL